MAVYYFCVVCLRFALKLSAAVAFVVSLPVMPFVVAYRNRSKSPDLAKAIYLVWGLLYLILLIFCIIG